MKAASNNQNTSEKKFMGDEGARNTLTVVYAVHLNSLSPSHMAYQGQEAQVRADKSNAAAEGFIKQQG